MRGVSLAGFLGSLVGTCLVLALAGCAGEEKPPGGSVSVNPGDDDGGSDIGADMCRDEDGDGFGRHCDAGTDCDDDDADRHEGCSNCVIPAKGCECEPGTPPRDCTPPKLVTEGGTLVCTEGGRFCREGKWSDCEALGQYVFVAD
jgi:hypothetical protein